MKIAQLLSTVPDLLPKEYSEQLTKLQSSAPRWVGICKKKNEKRTRKSLGDII